MESLSEQLTAARGMRDALAARIANDAVRGQLPGPVSIELYADYVARVKDLHARIIAAAEVAA